MSFHRGAFSATYHANIPVESIPGIPHHTTQNGFKSKRISPTSLTVDLIWKSGNAKDEHEQTTKPSTKAGDKDTMDHEQPLGIPGHKRPSLPHRRWILPPKSMLVTEVFVFKASASAWPKGKRHGSRSRLTSVRRHEIQMRHNSQFPTPSFQRTNSTGSRIQGKCRFSRGTFSSQYRANIPVESIPGIPHHTTQNEFKSKSKSPTLLTVN